jgi:ESCRT-I complex subunit VPS28|eukprot:scaffold815_cov273-Chaetoceros_neogracile.AAC.19
MPKFVPPGTIQRFKDDSEAVEIDLFDSGREREMYDNLGDLYSIIMATESLERAYARDAVTRDEYTAECNRLISQFRVAERVALGNSMSTDTFMQVYQLDCPRAADRLLRIGVPEQMLSNAESHKTAITVAETAEKFITAMDALKLETTAVDELQPLLSDLMNFLARLPDIPNEFEPNRIVQQWLQKLNLMRAVDEIEEAESRQLYMDLDSAYQEFKRYLSDKKSG